jgi:hypothetical protein
MNVLLQIFWWPSAGETLFAVPDPKLDSVTVGLCLFNLSV